MNMPRPRIGANLSICELERILEHRRSELQQLSQERAKLQKRLEEIDEHIHKLGGEEADALLRAHPPRIHNEKSLTEMIVAVLQQAPQPMRVSDIAHKTQELGYKTTSANFRGIVNQTLIKDKRFVATTRGFYTLKKA